MQVLFLKLKGSYLEGEAESPSYGTLLTEGQLGALISWGWQGQVFSCTVPNVVVVHHHGLPEFTNIKSQSPAQTLPIWMMRTICGSRRMLFCAEPSHPNTPPQICSPWIALLFARQQRNYFFIRLGSFFCP